MIFDTLLPHAKVLTENNEVGEPCFVLQSCHFGIELFKKSFVENFKQAKPKTKLDLPILLIGQKVEKIIPGRFQGSNTGNVSKNTFQKKKKDDLPAEWFPWLSSEKNRLSYNDFLSLLENFNDVSPEAVYELFTTNGVLFTFNPVTRKKTNDEASILEDMVSKSVYQVVTCKKPALAVHSVLALNALNEKAELLDEERDPSLIRKELLKFCLLFWMVNQVNSLKITDEKLEKDIRVEPKVIASGNIGDVSSLPLLLDAGGFNLGAHADHTASSHPIVKKFLSLIREDTIDRISLTRSNKVFTAPATGKAPTNAYRKTDSQNTLAPEIMLGFDRNEVNQFLPAYSNIIQDKAFSLTKALHYYVFPEDISLTGRYLEYLSGMISQLNGYKQDYFDWVEKSSSSPKAKKEKEKALTRIQEQRESLWEKSWSRFKLSELLFAFEENVGSSNQPQFAWTSAYRHLPAAKAFLFLEMMDNPAEFGRLAKLLNHTAQNLGGWKEKEVKRLVDRYFTSGRLDQIEYWMRWRKYLVRNDSSKNPIDAGLWEHAMGLIIQIKTMNALNVDAEWDGEMLLNHLQERRKSMDEENQLKIRDYLTDFFLHGRTKQMPEKSEKGTAQVRQFIERQARNYGVFVDTRSDSWQAIIDGLVCGWALKQICFKIRDDYKSVIGGKSLAKHTPAQLRTLSIDLYSKAERAGANPWNVQTPIERMFKWSQKNPHTPEVVLFMDAVSLGFMRYDNPIEAAANDGENDDKTQNGGSDQ
ncbi:MAG: hypothetical protein JRE28_15545 [Deltaproteobacteria bacterium]|nr:hypothetical protein [Deltaproteobacteria bacterium]